MFKISRGLGAVVCAVAMGSLLSSAAPALSAAAETGAMDPETALNYMLATEDLVIVDTREMRYIDKSFVGALNIPWNEMAERYQEIPTDRPVLLHCGLGWVAPKAYAVLHQKVPALKLHYIDGAPRFDEYNHARSDLGKGL